MNSRSFRVLSALLPFALLSLSACGGAGSAITPARPATTAGGSPVVLPAGAPRPLTSHDSLTSVVRDTSAGSNLNAAQLDALNRMTLFKGVVTSARNANGNARNTKNVTTQSPYEHANIGSFFSTGGYNGVYSTQSWANFAPASGTANIFTNLQGQPSSNVVYADTTKGPGGECFESGSGYWAAPTGASGAPFAAFYVFDFCRNGGQFVVVKPLGTSAWYPYSHFVSNPDGTYNNLYTIENFLASDGNWHAMLYNYRTSTWEDLYSESGSLSSGSAGYTEGWSFTEYYNAPSQGSGAPGYCQNIGYDTYYQMNEPVQATAYLLPVGSTSLVAVSSANAYFGTPSTDPSGTAQCWSYAQDGSYPSYNFSYVGSSGPTDPASEWTVVTHNF